MDNNLDSQNLQYINDTLIYNGFQMKEILSFLKTKKIDGEILDNWNIDELLIVTQEFIEQKQKYQYPSLNEIGNSIQYLQQHPLDGQCKQDFPQVKKQPEQEEQKQYVVPNVNPRPSIQFQGNRPILIEQIDAQINQQQMELPINQIDNQAYYKIMECKKLNKNTQSPLNDGNLSIMITKHENVSAGMFKKDFVIYTLVLIPSGITIQRRYSDFEQLREYLVQQYPEFLIPPIPPKKSKSKEQNIIEYRKGFFETFCRRLLNNQEVKADPIVDLFFTVQEEKIFKNIYNQKSIRLIDSKNIKNLDGHIELGISQKIDQYFFQSSAFHEQVEQIHKKIRILSRKIIQDYQSVSNNMKQISLHFTQIQCLYQDFNQTSPLGKNSLQESINNVLSDTFRQISTNLDEQSNLIRANVINQLKFRKQEFKEIQNLMKYRENQQQELNKQFGKLLSRNEKSLKDQGVQKVEKINGVNQMMGYLQLQDPNILNIFQNTLPKDTQFFIYLRDMFAYINYQSYDQIKKQENDFVKDIAMSFIQFGQMQIQLQEKYLQWPSIIDQFYQLGNKKERVSINQNLNNNYETPSQ